MNHAGQMGYKPILSDQRCLTRWIFVFFVLQVLEVCSSFSVLQYDIKFNSKKDVVLIIKTKEDHQVTLGSHHQR